MMICFDFNFLRVLLLYRYPFTADQDIPEMDWEVYLRETANAIVGQQTPQRWVNTLACSYKFVFWCTLKPKKVASLL